MKETIRILVIAFALGAASLSEAKNMRATEMSSSAWSQLQSGPTEETTIEFRQGDELPVNFGAEGDLVETSQAATTYVRVKRNFWVRVKGDKISMSLDGAEFKPLNQVLKGDFSAGTGGDGNPVNAVSLLLRAYLK